MRTHERCAACGFDGGSYADHALADALRSLGGRWRELLDASGPHLRTRPAPDVWSAIEYAAHSRDVTSLHVFGVEQALDQDEPAFPEIDGDRLVDEAAQDYGSVDPEEVGAELAAAATRLADVAVAAGVDRWARGLTVGTERHDVRWLLEHALHDSLHHLADVERGLVSLRPGPTSG